MSREWTSTEIQQIHQYGDDHLASGATADVTRGDLQQQQHSENSEAADADDDESMDDDMMDKISSSPSIDDGRCTTLVMWPARIDSLSRSRQRIDPACVEVEVGTCQEATRESVASDDGFAHPPMLHDTKQVSDAEVFPDGHDWLHREGEYGLLYGAEDIEQRVTCSHTQLPVLEASQSRRADRCDEVPPLDQDTDPSGHNPITPSQVCSTSWESEQDDDIYENIYEEAQKITPHPRFIDSGWSGECLRDSEDIDFEFVYALHTFVATVEGQANATKGDTMVLLDDSNSYWWLVRVVKDSSIGTYPARLGDRHANRSTGYLPAEHIETPTERLARLNKHRNIDVGVSQLLCAVWSDG